MINFLASYMTISSPSILKFLGIMGLQEISFPLIGKPLIFLIFETENKAKKKKKIKSN